MKIISGLFVSFLLCSCFTTGLLEVRPTLGPTTCTLRCAHVVDLVYGMVVYEAQEAGVLKEYPVKTKTRVCLEDAPFTKCGSFGNGLAGCALDAGAVFVAMRYPKADWRMTLAHELVGRFVLDLIIDFGTHPWDERAWTKTPAYRQILAGVQRRLGDECRSGT